MGRPAIALLMLLGTSGCGSHKPGSRADAIESRVPLAVAVAVDQARCAGGDCERVCDSRGDGAACALAAERNWQGRHGRTFDPARSFRYAMLGCDANHGYACALLGQHHEYGIGTAWAPLRAAAAYKKSCNAGDGSGCSGLAMMYHRGHGVDPDVVKADLYADRAWRQWRAACETDQPRWCPAAAAIVRKQRGPNADARALALEQRACQHGVPDGCVGVLIDQLGARETHRAAVRGLDDLCEFGEPRACHVLAWLFDGDNAPADRRDPERALKLTERSCDLGDRDDCVKAANLHERGDKNREATRYFNERACDRGAGRGCLQLAQDAYVAGSAEVASFARRACQAGQVEGCDLLLRVLGVHTDDVALDRWATEGCRLGSWHACERLVERNRELPQVNKPGWPGWRKQLYQAACVEPDHPACGRLAKLEYGELPVLRALRDAVARRDTVALAQLAPRDITVSGLWFDTAECTRQFSGTVIVTPGAQPALLHCLGALGLRLEPEASRNRTPALMYDPGVVLSLDIQDGMIRRITGPSAPVGNPAAATISSEALASHLIAGTRSVDPGPVVRDAVAGDAAAVAVVPLQVCVDANGKLIKASALDHPQRDDGYLRAVEAAASQWQFRPFEVRGSAVPVCALDVFVYPAERWRRVRLPGAESQPGGRTAADRIAPEVFNAHRLEGKRAIVPDAETQEAIAEMGVRDVVGTFKLCITATGAIGSIRTLKSTGFSRYDQTIEHELRNWKYKPIWINGVPTPVCSSVTFRYAQR